MLTRFFALIGFLVTMLIVVGGIVVYSERPKPKPLPDALVLKLDLSDGLPRLSFTPPLLEAMSGGHWSVQKVISALDQASHDPRVKGLVVTLGQNATNAVGTADLRQAIDAFRQSGRFTYAFAPSFGEAGSGNRDYYLATAFDQIWVQPTGLVGLMGVAMELPFARQLLDKIGIKPEVNQREAYKTVFESFTNAGASAATQSMTQRLLDRIFDEIINAVSAGRKIDPQQVRLAADQGPLTGKEALEFRLIDKIGYEDQVKGAACKQAGIERCILGLAEYMDSISSGKISNKLAAAKDAAQIAVIEASGIITQGYSSGGQFGPVSGPETTGSATVAEAFEAAISDTSIRAILFYVDSPGGSAVASETIRRQVVRARALKKPVVVLMGDYAASGGYWVAMNADRIIASPFTLTGSIGVVSGKLATAELWDKLGVHWQRFGTTPNAGAESMVSPYTSAQIARVNKVLDQIYYDFKFNVGKARKLSPDQVQALAQGQVWTGREALDLKLVDGVGGLRSAETALRQVLKLDASAPLVLRPFPFPSSPLDRLLKLVGGGGGGVEAMIGAGGWQNFGLASFLSLLHPPGVVEIPRWQVQ
jgi:protease IV